MDQRTPRPEALSLALYLVPDGCEPLWYEVLVPLYLRPPMKPNGTPIAPRVVRVVGRRPRVGLVVPSEEEA